MSDASIRRSRLTSDFPCRRGMQHVRLDSVPTNEAKSPCHDSPALSEYQFDRDEPHPLCMTFLPRVIWAFALSFIAVVLCGLAVEFAPARVAHTVRFILIPGSLLDLFLSGNIHAGFGGLTSVAVTVIGSSLCWVIPVFGLLTIIHAAKGSK